MLLRQSHYRSSDYRSVLPEVEPFAAAAFKIDAKGIPLTVVLAETADDGFFCDSLDRVLRTLAGSG